MDPLFLPTCLSPKPGANPPLQQIPCVKVIIHLIPVLVGMHPEEEAEDDGVCHEDGVLNDEHVGAGVVCVDEEEAHEDDGESDQAGDPRPANEDGLMLKGHVFYAKSHDDVIDYEEACTDVVGGGSELH